MLDRPNPRFRPSLEKLEPKRPLSAGGVTAGSVAVSVDHADPTGRREVAASSLGPKPNFGYLVYRITNPTPANNRLVGPFGHVQVQPRTQVPGETYNILFITVRNGTSKTFDASSGFFVKFPNAPRKTPILTGDQTWAPGQTFIFYILSKKYYPLPSQVHSGYVFTLAGAKSVAIPGPSGIFQRVTYNPETIDRVLDRVVTRGPGNQGGIGVHFGLPNTSIYEFVSSREDRKDFGGYF